ELPELVLLELAVEREATALVAAVDRGERVHEHRRAVLGLGLLHGLDLHLVQTLGDLTGVPARALLGLGEVETDLLRHDGSFLLLVLLGFPRLAGPAEQLVQTPDARGLEVRGLPGVRLAPR